MSVKVPSPYQMPQEGLVRGYVHSGARYRPTLSLFEDGHPALGLTFLPRCFSLAHTPSIRH